MNRLKSLLMVGLCLLTMNPAVFAEDPFDQLDKVVAAQSQDSDTTSEDLKVKAFRSAWEAEQHIRAGEDTKLYSRIIDLEKRMNAVETKAIDAKEAREIAEAVVEETLAELRLAITTASGGQRVQSVNLSTTAPTSEIMLAPGEQISGYTDVVTGQWHRVGQPTRVVQVQTHSQPLSVAAWETPTVEIRSENYAVSQPRRVQFRPVRNTFAAIRAANQCRMVNGVMVCN